MDVEQPSPAEHWDSGRGETEAERLDRNWSSLLQELRVLQTGVQLLTGFLLVLPFSDRFSDLDSVMRGVYLVTVGCSITATVLLIAPVNMHRVLFRRHRLDRVVSRAHRYAVVGTLLLGIALAGVATIIFDAVANRPSGWTAGGCSLLALAVFWYAIPLRSRSVEKTTY